MQERARHLLDGPGPFPVSLDFEIRSGRFIDELRRIRHSFKPRLLFYNHLNQSVFSRALPDWDKAYHYVGDVCL